ncbi:AI-2E family transporter [Thermohalobacter berrensis]|uniref:AI-2E family transporter n=2 Tax=Thermohalobacter berrensis TaxID=99594 RepID=A0A419TBD5_9FIRM|nr:AI-2E family transporter [Thermohalobacter berrensis]
MYKKSAGLLQLLYPFIFAIIFAYLLNPLVNRLENKGISRVFGILIVYVLLIGIVLVISFSIFPKIANEFKKLVEVLPTYFNQLYDFFNNMYIRYSENIENLPPEFQAVKNIVRENLNTIQNTVLNSIRNLTNTIINMFSRILSFIIIPILTFYFLKDKDVFKKKLFLILPKPYRTDVVKVTREIDSVLGKFIRGQLIVAAFVGISTTIGLLILKVDFALIIGLIAGIANVIPYFGPIIGAIPAIIFAFLDKPSKVLWVIILFTVIQQIESGIISPKVVGKSVGLHPVIVILSLLIGGSFFGVLGMLLAVPVAVIIKISSAFIVEKLVKL